MAGPLVALAQLNSQPNVVENLAVVSRLVAEAAGRGASMVVLPENFAIMGATEQERASSAEVLTNEANGPILDALREVAQRHRVALIGGGMPEASGDPARPYNACVAMEASGKLVAVYRKIHLFDVDLADGTKFTESDYTRAGSEVVVCELAGLKVGLSICYDLRFPELYRRLRDAGAELVVVPAAFTLTTGRDHWTPLLRARAIEQQVWVAAPGQWGAHPKGRQTYGKSVLVDPWGDVVAQHPEGVGVVVGEVRAGRVDDVRRAMPVARHRVLV
jgi:predicted amidohydrolase